MVLLTSSAISVVISGAIVFLFTFLLFLSGYVLQQQTVRSLQEALQAPIEVRVQLPPGYQRNFKSAEDVLLAVAEEQDVVVEQPEPLDDGGKPTGQTVEIVLEQTTQPDLQPSSDEVSKEPTPQQLWHAQIDKSSNQQQPIATQQPQIRIDPSPFTTGNNIEMRLAYVLSLPSPSDLCSALLFTKWHRENSAHPASQFNIIYLYPSNWETSPNNAVYKDALRLLIESEHKYSVLLHPVQISKVWTGIDVESQLLSELARNPWIYDRVMYLRSPGILIDAARLDDAVVSSYMTPGIVKMQWTKLKAPVRRSAATSLRPDVLLFAQGRGLMVPAAGSARSVAARADSARDDGYGEEMKDDWTARDAAYVLFEEDDLILRRKEKIARDDLTTRFERERQAICEGTLLLS